MIRNTPFKNDTLCIYWCIQAFEHHSSKQSNNIRDVVETTTTREKNVGENDNDAKASKRKRKRCNTTTNRNGATTLHNQEVSQSDRLILAQSDRQVSFWSLRDNRHWKELMHVVHVGGHHHGRITRTRFTSTNGQAR